MNCAKAGRLLVDYSEGLLEGGTKRALERHLSGCERCRTELSRIETVRESVLLTETPERDADFWNNFNRKLSQKLAEEERDAPERAPAGSSPVWQARLAVAAAAMTVLLIAALAVVSLMIFPVSPERAGDIPEIAGAQAPAEMIEIDEDFEVEFFIANGSYGADMFLADFSDEEMEDLEEDMFLMIDEELQSVTEDMVLDDIYEPTVYDLIEDLSAEEFEELYEGLGLT